MAAYTRIRYIEVTKLQNRDYSYYIIIIYLIDVDRDMDIDIICRTLHLVTFVTFVTFYESYKFGTNRARFFGFSI